MSELSVRDQELVALGAAIASNCIPCIEYHIPAARRVGLSASQIREALHVAEKVRRVPARAVMQTAVAKIGEGPDEAVVAEEPGCGCSGSDQPAGEDCGT
jgi:4-carboxymuconolactone decarboxylase